MDTLSSIEFIDLSDVDEKERLWILNFLHSWDTNVKVPWKKPRQNVKATVPLESVSNNLHSVTHQPLLGNVVLPGPINLHDRNNLNPLTHQHLYPSYIPVISYNQPIYQNVIYSPIDTKVGMMTVYPQQQVVSNDVSDDNYSCNKNNTEEKPELHHNSVYMNEQSVSQTSNKYQQQKHVCEIKEELVHENGEQQLQENDGKETIVITKPVNKSWASLFSKNTSTEHHSNHVEVNGQRNGVEEEMTMKANSEINVKIAADSSIKSDYNDPVYYRLGEYLAEHEIDHRTISLQPRGLINRSNYCYINSILQALLACPPVYNLLTGLSEKITTNAKRNLTPVIDNMSKFVKEFQHLPATHRVSRRTDKSQKQDPNSLINYDTPFEPSYIYKMLNGIRSDSFVVEGRQEDAEEFLGCLLNGLNDEMMELMKLVGKGDVKPAIEISNVDNDVDKEWTEVTGKNKGCVTRRTEVVQTPISDIFNGHLRSRVHRTGDKSTDNVQPFFTLQLNIEKVNSVKEALEALVCKNQLEGVTSSKTNEEVEAWQQVTIEDLPYVLILHLKCFDYKLDGCTKIIKALEFPIDLKIDAKLLSSKTNYSPKAKQYKLFAIVYHDGKEASKGHYLTDAYHVGYARWLRYDDAAVKAVPEDQVLKPHGTRVPYLLFYRRSDSIRSK